MKIFTTWIVATLAFVALTDAAPVGKHVKVIKAHKGAEQPADLPLPKPTWSDNDDKPHYHHQKDLTTAKPTHDESSGSNDGSNEDDGYDGSNDGSNEDDGYNGSNEGSNEDDGYNGSNDGSNEDGNGDDVDTKQPDSVKHTSADANHGGYVWDLFDGESSGSNDDDGEGSNGDGSAEDPSPNTHKPAKGSERPSPTMEEQPQPFDEDPTTKPTTLKLAGVQLAANVATQHGLHHAKTLVVTMGLVGAAIGAVAAVLGVMHLRRQQERDALSTLAADLPEPQTGREESKFDTMGEAQDALASSSVDLEEALTDAQDEESEGEFANDMVV